MALEVLRALERITGKRTYELFDYICGVSTGSILAFLLGRTTMKSEICEILQKLCYFICEFNQILLPGAHKKTLEEAEVLYKDLSREIFSQNSFLGSAALLWRWVW